MYLQVVVMEGVARLHWQEHVGGSREGKFLGKEERARVWRVLNAWPEELVFNLHRNRYRPTVEGKKAVSILYPFLPSLTWTRLSVVLRHPLSPTLQVSDACGDDLSWPP